MGWASAANWLLKLSIGSFFMLGFALGLVLQSGWVWDRVGRLGQGAGDSYPSRASGYFVALLVFYPDLQG